MWLRRLVGIVLVISVVGMNVLVGIGLFKPDPNKQVPTILAPTLVSPTVTITATPGTVTTGTTSALTWTTTGGVTDCAASGNWSGPKTPFGAESTGRLTKAGNFVYKLSCKNDVGSVEASTTVVSTNAPVTSKQAVASTGTGGTPTVSYCSGRTPCYGPKDIGTHGSSGNCWGWLGDRAINVGSFDLGFHVGRSTVSSIQISGICGKDLSAAISGKVSTSEYPSGHDHSLGAKSASDRNYISYFVGYFDSTKP